MSDANLPGYLAQVGLIGPGEEVVVEPLGDGNINWVRRFRTKTGSRVVKQARPALERFPEYRVSTERILFEARYYETVAAFDHEGICPQVLYFDPAERVLVLGDVGPVERLDAALARGADLGSAAAAIGRFLGRVHAGTRGPDLAARFANDEMRRLHGDHIFRLPFRPNAFPLSPTLRARAHQIQTDARLVARIDSAYARYLEPRGSLVHGDVQATNVLLASRGPTLLDAEISHVGDPAFDIGQLVAHLLLPAIASGKTPSARAAVEAAWSAYAEGFGPGCPDFADAAAYAGVELLRRTLGAARVPAVASDAAGLEVVSAGIRLVAGQPTSPKEL